MKTSIPELQAYLEELVALIDAGDKAAFVEKFVPLDLVGSEDAAAYLETLNSDDMQWTHLAADIKAIVDGANVTSITGTKEEGVVCFFFEHPMMEGCDREVAFTVNGSGVWRAEG